MQSTVSFDAAPPRGRIGLMYPRCAAGIPRERNPTGLSQGSFHTTTWKQLWSKMDLATGPVGRFPGGFTSRVIIFTKLFFFAKRFPKTLAGCNIGTGVKNSCATKIEGNRCKLSPAVTLRTQFHSLLSTPLTILWCGVTKRKRCSGWLCVDSVQRTKS